MMSKTITTYTVYDYDDDTDDYFLISAKSETVVSTIVRVHVYELCLT